MLQTLVNEKTILDNQKQAKPLDPAEVVADTPEKRPWSKPTITTEGNVFESTLQKDGGTYEDSAYNDSFDP